MTSLSLDFPGFVQQMSNSDPSPESLLNTLGANMLVLLILLVLVLVGLGGVEPPTSRLSDSGHENAKRWFAKALAATGPPATWLRERISPPDFRQSVKQRLNVESPKGSRAELPARAIGGIVVQQPLNFRRRPLPWRRQAQDRREIRPAHASLAAYDRVTFAQLRDMCFLGGVR